MVTVLAVAMLSAGCSPPVIHTDVPRTTAQFNETPVASNFPTNNQLKLQASQHWLNIADDTARAVVQLLKQPRTCPASVATCKTIFVKEANLVTEFSRVFHNQLITTLVKQGLSVSKNPETDLMVEMDIQPVLFAPNRPQYRHAGEAVQLGAGIWGLRDVASMSPPNPSIAPPEPDALHWFRSEFAVGQTPQAEIVVTVSIVNGARYVSRVSNAYYIADTDRRLYEQELCSLYRLCEKRNPNLVKPVASKSASAIDVVGDCTTKGCVDRGTSAPSKKQKSTTTTP